MNQLDVLNEKLSAYKRSHSTDFNSDMEKLWEIWTQKYFIETVKDNERQENTNNILITERSRLSTKYLHGNGIEIGALHNPLPVKDSARVSYVDRLPNTALSLHYPELNNYTLVPVDIIDNGEDLKTFDTQTLDFVICNHFIEHCQNPLKALENSMRVLRQNGILYCAIPDKRYTFDIERSTTTFDHLLRDYREGPGVSISEHYQECSKIINRKAGIEHQAWWRFLEALEYSIHFHVWTQWDMLEMLSGARKELRLPFNIKELCAQGNECIFIIEKAYG